MKVLRSLCPRSSCFWNFSIPIAQFTSSESPPPSPSFLFSGGWQQTASGRQRWNRAAGEDTSARLLAVRLLATHKDVGYSEEGSIEVLSGQGVRMRLFGRGFTNETKIRLTTVTKEFGQDCKSDMSHRQTEAFPLQGNDEGTMATVDIPGEAMVSAWGDDGESLPYYLCLKSPDQAGFVHQGTNHK